MGEKEEKGRRRREQERGRRKGQKVQGQQRLLRGEEGEGGRERARRRDQT